MHAILTFNGLAKKQNGDIIFIAYVNCYGEIYSIIERFWASNLRLYYTITEHLGYLCTAT